jgi:uncharacterized membrane protein (GlpM family)
MLVMGIKKSFFKNTYILGLPPLPTFAVITFNNIAHQNRMGRVARIDDTIIGGVTSCLVTSTVLSATHPPHRTALDAMSGHKLHAALVSRVVTRAQATLLGQGITADQMVFVSDGALENNIANFNPALQVPPNGLVHVRCLKHLNINLLRALINDNMPTITPGGILTNAGATIRQIAQHNTHNHTQSEAKAILGITDRSEGAYR